MKNSFVEEEVKYSYKDFISSIDSFKEKYAGEINEKNYFGFPLEPILEAERKLLSLAHKSIGYFSMEYGITPSIYNTFQYKRAQRRSNKSFAYRLFSNDRIPCHLFKTAKDKLLDIPIYGGGLGVLAGDTIKSSADLAFSLCGFGILWNRGYLKQKLTFKQGQISQQQIWDPHTYPGLIPLKNIVKIDTKEGPLHLRLWKYYVYSHDHKNVCPIVLLDSNLKENNRRFRMLTDQLYRSDEIFWRISQRLILGIGGMKALENLKYNIDCYHLNEGHAAFALVEKYLSLKDDEKRMDIIKEKFVFTCHTPISAGHDRFNIFDVARILKADYIDVAQNFGKELPYSDDINLTFMCLNNCERINAVSVKHKEVMHLQFPNFKNKIKAVTNGTHVPTWVSESFQNLFDKYQDAFGDWRNYPENFSNIEKLRESKTFREDLLKAHQMNKSNFKRHFQQWDFDENAVTICWARRMAGYKRPELIFHQIKQLIKMGKEMGKIQLIIAGKAHPNDNIGKGHVWGVLNHIEKLKECRNVLKILLVENYDTYFGKLLASSADIWLNNPLPPFEASGTSGMKAILNGVLQLSTVDGWIAGAPFEDIGWVFGYKHDGKGVGSESELRFAEDSKALIEALKKIVQLYYQTNMRGKLQADTLWVDKMINCIKTAGFFNTHRMLTQYKKDMWQVD